MSERFKVAISIDYSLRIPAFKDSYGLFKSFIFKDNLDTSFEDEFTSNDPRFYWQRELSNEEVFNFYMRQNVDKVDDETLLGNFSSYFFNEDHYKKFLEEYSFHLYAEANVASTKDINIINIAQSQLFDITLFDRYENSRKINNSLFFLSKIRIYPQTITFLSTTQELKSENYIGIWDPSKNPEQKNSETSTLFLDWMKDLEQKYIKTK